MRKLKKGFTLVELVIVIAVIAVLTAVLVPTFIHLTKKAKDASDKTVVKNANIQLAAQEQTEGKNKSMSDAVKDVDEIGYHIPGVATGNGNKIVWDKNTDRFVLLDKNDKVLHSDAGVSEGTTLSQSDKANYFYAVSSLEDRGDFAVYAKSDFGGSTTFTSPISFDAGDTNEEDGTLITAISYDFDDEGEVLVATNSADTVLTIDTPSAEFKHVGLIGKEIITRVKGSTFVEYGKVGFVQIDSGHYVADQGSNVKAVYATHDAAKVDQLNGGVIENAYAKDDTVLNDGHNVTLVVNANQGAVEEAAMTSLHNDVDPQPYADAAADDYFALLDGSGNFVNYLKAITDTDSIPTNHTIVLIKDCTQFFTYIVNKTVTLDLNGHSLDLSSKVEGIGAWNNGKLIVIDSQESAGHRGSLSLSQFDIMPGGWMPAGCVEIHGGYFRIGRTDFGNDQGTSISPILMGGTYNLDVTNPSTMANVASGYHGVNNGNGTWSVVAD